MRPFATLLLSLAAATVSGSVIPDGGSLVATKKVDGRDEAVTAVDLDNFKFFAQYAGAAYCNNDALAGAVVTCTNDVCPLATANGAKVLLALNGDTTSNMDGFVALDPVKKLIVVSFRGSSSVRNWIANVLFLFVPCTTTEGCAVHTGFSESWKQVEADVVRVVNQARAENPTFKVVTTGHSLGGAVATLAGANLRAAGIPVDIYTYGSPRVGNLAFVEYVSAQSGGEYRLTHTNDPVPRLPPLFAGYRHTSPEYWMHTGSAKTTSYGSSDIRVCKGYANIACNSSPLIGIDIDAHLYYFLHISGCGTGTLPFRRRDDVASGGENSTTTADGGDELSDEEMIARLQEWAKMDEEYVASLEETGSSAV